MAKPRRRRKIGSKKRKARRDRLTLNRSAVGKQLSKKPKMRVELTTPALRKRCSAIELLRR